MSSLNDSKNVSKRGNDVLSEVMCTSRQHHMRSGARRTRSQPPRSGRCIPVRERHGKRYVYGNAEQIAARALGRRCALPRLSHLIGYRRSAPHPARRFIQRFLNPFVHCDAVCHEIRSSAHALPVKGAATAVVALYSRNRRRYATPPASGPEKRTLVPRRGKVSPASTASAGRIQWVSIACSCARAATPPPWRQCASTDCAAATSRAADAFNRPSMA